MKTKVNPVNKYSFYGVFIGVFGGALGANIVAGVSATATVAFLVVTLAIAIVGVALVAFTNDERLTVIETEVPINSENAVLLGEAVDRIVELETHDFTITDGQEPDGTPIK